MLVRRAKHEARISQNAEVVGSTHLFFMDLGSYRDQASQKVEIHEKIKASRRWDLAVGGVRVSCSPSLSRHCSVPTTPDPSIVLSYSVHLLRAKAPALQQLYRDDNHPGTLS